MNELILKKLTFRTGNKCVNKNKCVNDLLTGNEETFLHIF